MEFFIKGVILGFSIAAPVGPIGILCIRKTIHYGRLSGLCTGLGAAVADTFYGALAVFGLTIVSQLLVSLHVFLQLFGAAFLFYLGVKIFRSIPLEQKGAVTHITLLKDFFTTFILTLTNPMTIVSYLVIFAGLGISQNISAHGVSFIGGVFIGSALWWLVLSEGVALFRKKVSQRMMQWINRGAGLLLIGFGCYFLIGAFITKKIG